MRSSAFERRMIFDRADERQPPNVMVSAFERTSIVPHS
jgi:hypothetical protein